MYANIPICISGTTETLSIVFFFFFSSRRRHTRLQGDWSSDVCSSDLAAIVHARTAVLGGLSPKDNREVPPLRHDIVRRLKDAFPTLPIVVNGGLREPRAVLEALSWCDGVMLGRQAYHPPSVLAELHRALHPAAGALPTREALIARMERYVARQLAARQRPAAGNRH